jgi:hypothetical protein
MLVAANAVQFLDLFIQRHLADNVAGALIVIVLRVKQTCTDKKTKVKGRGKSHV